MKRKFNIGDKVVRVTCSNEGEDEGEDDNGVPWVLPVGAVTFVTGYDHNLPYDAIEVDGFPSAHDAQWFELYEPQIEGGSRVVVKGDMIPYFSDGDVGVVMKESDRDWIVDFNECGNKVVHGDGMWYVPKYRCTLAKRLMSTFTEPAKYSVNAGHVPDSGLQKHSLGDIYPLAVVGYGHAPTIFVVENLEAGTVATYGGSRARQWPSAKEAYEFAKHTKEYACSPIVYWESGRPVNKNGVMVMR